MTNVSKQDRIIDAKGCSQAVRHQTLTLACVGSNPATPAKKTMVDVAQLVRALVCGTRGREFESHLPPHALASRKDREAFCFLKNFLQQKLTKLLCLI